MSIGAVTTEMDGRRQPVNVPGAAVWATDGDQQRAGIIPVRFATEHHRGVGRGCGHGIAFRGRLVPGRGVFEVTVAPATAGVDTVSLPHPAGKFLTAPPESALPPDVSIGDGSAEPCPPERDQVPIPPPDRTTALSPPVTDQFGLGTFIVGDDPQGAPDSRLTGIGAVGHPGTIIPGYQTLLLVIPRGREALTGAGGTPVTGIGYAPTCFPNQAGTDTVLLASSKT